MKKKSAGVTVIEVLIAAFIFVIISGGMWTILSSTRRVADLSQAKDEAKGMAETVLKHLQQDIASSKAVIDKDKLAQKKPAVTMSFASSGNQLTMKVPKPGVNAKLDSDYVDVVYTLNGQELSRQDGNTGLTRILCQNVSKLEAFILSENQVSIEIETELKPPGATSPVTHNQRVLVTVREAVANAADARWITSDELSSY